jgi:hypothetical protein
MNLPKTKTSLLWKAAIRDLSANGKQPIPEDIVWLYTLAERVYHPTSYNRHLAFTRAPIVLPARSVCGPQDSDFLTLYPITFQGVTWLLAVSEWWTGGDLLPAAYACAHSDGIPCATFAETDQRAVESAVETWASGLPCAVEDLRAAVRIQTNAPEGQVTIKPEPTDTDATEWGELLALLAGVYHIAPWEILMRPWKDVEDLLKVMPRIAAFNGAMSAVSQDDRRKDALREFHEAVLFLKKGGSSEPATKANACPTPNQPSGSKA